MRCLVGGAPVDEIDYYNRVHEMMSILTSTNNRDSDDAEGFGYRWDSTCDYFVHSAATMLGTPSQTRTGACCKPLLGLFSL